MRTHATITTALTSLRANLGRSLLTILGIVIGVAAIILVVSLGQGAQQLILNEFESVGATAVILRPGRQPTSPANFADTLFSESIKDPDIDALRRKQNVPNAVSVDPAILVPGTVSHDENIYRPTTFGWTASAMIEIFDIEPSQGGYFTDADIRERARVAVIGDNVRDKLFGNEDPIGQTIKIKNQNIRVVGVFPARGQVAFFNIDDLVFLPYTTAQRTILGIDHYHEVFIRADSEDNVDFVAADVEATIREQHGIDNPDKDDFFVQTQQNAVETISTVTDILTIFLAAIAAIALLVGGIGIMNIMLVSVTERTSEIGLRKAVGASNKDILQQFLAEAVILTAAGGVIGTLIALAAAYTATIVIRTQFSLSWPFILPIGAILLGVGIAAATGLLFGLYPARQAAKKDPIEALRYE